MLLNPFKQTRSYPGLYTSYRMYAHFYKMWQVVVAVCKNEIIYIQGLALYFHTLVNANIQWYLQIWMTTFNGYACFIWAVVTDLCALSKPKFSFHSMFKYYPVQFVWYEADANVCLSGILLTKRMLIWY